METIGDAFMCAGGVPDALSPVEGARRAADMALAMIEVSMSSYARLGSRLPTPTHFGPCL